MLDLPGWPGHRAGQHVDIRLTAEDGYQAQRSYSIASAPEDDLLTLTIERLDDGEVSPYLTDVLEPGDELELRGPIGGYFVWEASLPGPLQLIAGGSGIVPLRAMLRHWAAADRPVAARLLYSARSLDDAIYREELLGLAAYDEARRPDRADAGVARRLVRPSRAHRPRARRRGGMAAAGAAAHLRVRADRLRRGGRGAAGGERPPTRQHQDRALRTDRRLSHGRPRRQRDRRRALRGLRPRDDHRRRHVHELWRQARRSPSCASTSAGPAPSPGALAARASRSCSHAAPPASPATSSPMDPRGELRPGRTRTRKRVAHSPAHGGSGSRAWRTPCAGATPRCAD